jgi:hypothetical protein
MRDPYARGTLGAGLRAMGNMAREIMTRPIDSMMSDRERDHALLRTGDSAWMLRVGEAAWKD